MGYATDLAEARKEIFLRMGLDGWNQIDPVQQIAFFVNTVRKPERSATSSPQRSQRLLGRPNAKFKGFGSAFPIDGEAA